MFPQDKYLELVDRQQNSKCMLASYWQELHFDNNPDYHWPFLGLKSTKQVDSRDNILRQISYLNHKPNIVTISKYADNEGGLYLV